VLEDRHQDGVNKQPGDTGGDADDVVDDVGDLANQMAEADVGVDNQGQDDLDDAAGDGQDKTDDGVQLGTDDHEDVCECWC